MRRTIFFALLLLVASLSSFSSLAQQPVTPNKKLPENKPAEQTIDVEHIAIDLQFNWQRKQAFGTATITFRPLKATNKIDLDAAMLTITSVTKIYNPNLGAKIEKNSVSSEREFYTCEYAYSDTNTKLEIYLNRMYHPSEIISLKINYQTNYVNEADPNNIWGSFGKGIRFFQPSSTEPKKKKQIWSSGEPEGNRYWFPCNDEINDLRTTEFTATVDTPLMVIANGNLIKIEDNKNGTKTYSYKSDKPYPNFLTSFVVGKYTDVKRRYEDIILHTFCYPDEVEATEATIARFPEMIKFFSEKTGVKYPYKQYSQVTVQDYPFPGMVGQNTVSIVSENMIDDYGTHADFLYLWDGVEAHALASQWFGNLISIKNWSDAWLNQSFARYFDGLYNSYKNGRSEFLLYYINPDLNATITDWNTGYRRPIVTNKYEDLTTFTSDNYTIKRGALVLRMLQKELGEEKWWRIIKKYTQTYAGKQVTTKDFQKVVETVTSKPMDWFFNQWLYKMGHPVFEVEKVYNIVEKQLRLTLKQVQNKDSLSQYPQVQYFQGKMDIEIDGKVVQVWIEPKAVNEFKFSSNQQPKLVQVDVESYWIKEINFGKPLAELLYQVEHDKDVLGKQWAVTQLVKIAKDEKTPDADKIKIYAAFRKAILSNTYWRFRGNTMFQLRSLLKPPYDAETIAMLLQLIQNDKPWVKTGAITFLGMTKDIKYENIYINALSDTSDRVINAAAIALGKTKSPKAYELLIKLKDKPSWKNQSLISTLNGLKELGDIRAVDLALDALIDSKSPHWNLATSVWDHRLAAAETLVALGKADKGYPLIFSQFIKAMEEGDINDIFYNVLQVTTLADPRGQEVFDLLKVKFKDDANAMTAVNQFEQQFKDAIKK